MDIRPGMNIGGTRSESDPNTGPNPWTVFFGGGDPTRPPSAQEEGHGGGGAPHQAAQDPTTTPVQMGSLRYDYFLGTDGHVYQEQRNLRGEVIGWKDWGQVGPAYATADTRPMESGALPGVAPSTYLSPGTPIVTPPVAAPPPGPPTPPPPPRPSAQPMMPGIAPPKAPGGM